MKPILSVLIGIALIAVLMVLAVGVVAMLRGGEFNRKYGNRLMRARVAMQAMAVVLVFALYMLNRG
jgi:hypothetical protein